MTTLPPEPPDGTLLSGGRNRRGNRVIWERHDASELASGALRWFRAGSRAVYTWTEAYRLRADPTRVLVETRCPWPTEVTP